MRITKLRTNHINNPLGFELTRLSLSWITETSHSKYQEAAQVFIALDEDFDQIVYDSGKRQDINSLAFSPEMKLKPRTRYYWKVMVWGDQGDASTSEVAWFETAKMEEEWRGQWMASSLDKEIHPLFRKIFTLPEDIVSARAYVCGLGIYELMINGQRIGEEYFTPGYNSYDFWLQYQTYDITSQLKSGDNAIGLMLGNGWYKGRFGFDGGYHKLYGNQFAFIAEVVATKKDGSTIVIGSDPEWKCAPSPIIFSGIYDGEVYDANKEISDWSLPTFDDTEWTNVIPAHVKTERLQARLSLPVKIMEERTPIDIIKTPADETVLDFGQNMTGWVRFKTSATRGQKLKLQHGEILQDGCFYNENLRTAKAEYIYISDGNVREVQPNFTFYGFRYVKLTGFEGEIDPKDFTGCVIYSELEETGSIKTSNPDVNRLFLNAMWGQKGNFLDVPTDCPQRDERMGWTGDAQIFASTACFNMYSPAFYTKYLQDLREEQIRISGSVPFIVPTLKPENDPGFVTGNGSAAWGDAATIIPWTLYLHYGDKELLKQHLNTMKDWVDYIKRKDDESGGTRLWKTGFHFADWLALDGKEPGGVIGGTDPYFVASAYYCYSARLVAKAATVLEKEELAKEYSNLSEEVKAAILHEYFTPSGRSAIHTQTAMIVALYMDLVPEHYRSRIIEDLKQKLRDDNMHLTTGFVGTPYFCHALSENGAKEEAYTLLLNDDYPSWLYAVKMGATTIWERWNSVLPDGKISGTDMNSLNHYAYGSIAEWMYRYMCGINPVEAAPGFKKFKLAPQPYGKLTYVKASFHSASGLIESSWEIKEDGVLSFVFNVPFNTTAELTLPDADVNMVKVNGETLASSGLSSEQLATEVCCTLMAGKYEFTYLPTKSYILTYSSECTIKEIINNEETKAIFTKDFPELAENSMIVQYNSEKKLTELMVLPFTASILTEERLEKLDEKLRRLIKIS
jgi:alpha-L-rhamnosidase